MEILDRFAASTSKKEPRTRRVGEWKAKTLGAIAVALSASGTASVDGREGDHDIRVAGSKVAPASYLSYNYAIFPKTHMADPESPDSPSAGEKEPSALQIQPQVSSETPRPFLPRRERLAAEEEEDRQKEDPDERLDHQLEEVEDPAKNPLTPHAKELRSFDSLSAKAQKVIEQTIKEEVLKLDAALVKRPMKLQASQADGKTGIKLIDLDTGLRVGSVEYDHRSGWISSKGTLPVNLEIVRKLADEYSKRQDGLFEKGDLLLGLALDGSLQEFKIDKSKKGGFSWIKEEGKFISVRAGRFERYINPAGKLLGEATRSAKWDPTEKERQEINRRTRDLEKVLPVLLKIAPLDPKRGKFVLDPKADVQEALSEYKDLRRELQFVHPLVGNVFNLAAWKLATTGQASKAERAAARQLAQIAVEAQPQNPELLDTLAAASAANGDYEKAVSTQKEAIRLAKEQNVDVEKIVRFQDRLLLYLDKKPYRE